MECEEGGSDCVKAYIVPQAHDEGHGGGNGAAHLRETTLLREAIAIAKDLLLVLAKVGGDGVAGDASDGGHGVGDDLAVLDVEALDLGEAAIAALDELGDDGHLLAGVEGEVGAGTVEGLVALAVGVEVTSIGIAVTSIASGGVGSSALVAFARVLDVVLARMGGKGRGDVVGLPDVHLGTAAAESANAGVDIVL